MTTYLITGGNGFIGRNLVNYLTLRSKSFLVVDKESVELDDIEFLKHDLTTGFPTERLRATKDYIIVHLAANPGVAESIARPVDSFCKNVFSTISCLESLKRGWARRMIFSSSASSSVSASPYLASKLACEALCEAYSKSYGLDISVLKLSNVYGPYSIHKDSVVHTFIKNCIRNRSLMVTGNGLQSRDFIYVDDVVESIYLNKKGYISSGKLTTILSLAHLVAKISRELMDYVPEIVNVKSVKGEVKSPTNMTDIAAPTDLEKGLRSTFKWYIENYAD